MGLPVELAVRYLRSRKRASISLGTACAILGVMIGTAALVTVMSITGGFREEFRQKVLGVNAHVLVLKYSSAFPEYREVMETVSKLPGVTGVGPFIINPMMVTSGERTQTGVLVKGVDPAGMEAVLDLPEHMVEGTREGLRLPSAKPARQPERDPLEFEALDQRSDPFDVDKDRGSKALLDALKASMNEEAEPTPAPNPAADWKVPAGAPVGGIEPEGGFAGDLPDDADLPDAVDEDPCRAGSDAELPSIIIGTALKEQLQVEVGDCIQITSPTIGYSYSRGEIRPPVAKQFRVIGVFYWGFDQYDAKLVFVDLYEAQYFYDSGDTVTGVEMKVSDVEDTASVLAAVDGALNNALYRTMDWEELNRGLFTALKVQQLLMSLVLALIILVAAFTVLATLIMVVLDKKKEIAVLKAMGATDSALLRSFLYQGGFIGVAGAILGLILGLLLCKWIAGTSLTLDPKVYFISSLPVRLRVWEFAFTGLFAVLVCLLGTLWPALYAARLRPAEAFRDQ